MITLRTLFACVLPWLCVAGSATSAEMEGESTPVPQMNVMAGNSETLDDMTYNAAAAAVRARQYNPLRAARLYAAVAVAQSSAADRIRSALAKEQQEAAGKAGGLMLNWLLPQEASARWMVSRSMDELVSSTAGSRGDELVARGLAVVAAIAERSLLDRSDSRRRPLAKPPMQPGIWARTPPLMAEQPTEPQSPGWLPWCPGTQALEPPPPPAYGSARWRADMTEVLEISRRLTPEQKQSAERWNLDVGSVTPPGVWNLLAREHLSLHPQPPARHYRILALLNIAMHDAMVTGWRVKLQYWTERPVTAIRREMDASFEPLVPTPPFPGYVSGHSIASGAAATILSRLLPDAAPRWQALAEEASESRLWGGIHPRFDNEEGLILGRRVAEACLDHFEPAGVPSGSVLLLKESADIRPYSTALPRMRVWREPAPE